MKTNENHQVTFCVKAHVAERILKYPGDAFFESSIKQEGEEDDFGLVRLQFRTAGCGKPTAISRLVNWICEALDPKLQNLSNEYQKENP